MDTKEMSVEEAIEFLETRIDKTDSAWEQRVYTEILEVIQSLSTAQVEGEKYKTMWEELPNMLESQFHNWDFSVLVKNMELLEQKYFPEESKGVQ
jgi:putative heme iron utilization protein